MKSHLLVIVFFWFLGIICAFGQNDTEVRTRIILQNNDVINGFIKIRDIPEEITLYNGKIDSLKIPARMIREVLIFNTSPEEGINTANFHRGKRVRYFNDTSFGVLSGESETSDIPFNALSIEMINGISFIPALKLGLGLGYDQYGTTRVIPFFLSLRGDILRQRITPYYFADIGTGSGRDNNEDNWTFETHAGLMYHLGMGIKLYSDASINIMLGLGYKYQYVKYDYDNPWGGIQETERKFKRMSLRIGIGF